MHYGMFEFQEIFLFGIDIPGMSQGSIKNDGESVTRVEPAYSNNLPYIYSNRGHYTIRHQIFPVNGNGTVCNILHQVVTVDGVGAGDAHPYFMVYRSCFNRKRREDAQKNHQLC